MKRQHPTPQAFPGTEAGDAEFFAATFGDLVRFDHRRGRWLVFSGHRWIPEDDGELHRLAIAAMRRRQKQALNVEDSEKRSKAIKWALAGEYRRRIENMLALAKAIRPVCDAGDNWDADPWLLAVANGVLDLRNGKLRKGQPEDRITMAARVNYDPAATCSLWERTFGEILNGDAEQISYFHRALGYSITGDCREECLFLCYGDGRNGKGTLLNTVAWLLGDYADDLPFSALELTERSGISNDIAKLVGKRFATASESSDTVRLNEARIKAMTGRDPITARFLHREYFTFTPVAKFWLSTNHKPIVRDDSEGFWRRLHFVPFTRSFAGCENRELKDKLRAEASGILGWLVRGALAWQRAGLNPPAVVRAATEEYRRESEPLAPFLSMCEIGKSQTVRAQHLYRAYQTWAADNGVTALTLRQFAEQIRKRFDASEHHNVVTYSGIGLAAAGTHRDPSLGFFSQGSTIEKSTGKRVPRVPTGPKVRTRIGAGRTRAQRAGRKPAARPRRTAAARL